MTKALTASMVVVRGRRPYLNTLALNICYKSFKITFLDIGPKVMVL